MRDESIAQRRAGPGEATPLLDLFLVEQDLMLQVAERVVRCRVAAEDIIQDAALKLCQSGVPGTSAATASTWSCPSR